MREKAGEEEKRVEGEKIVGERVEEERKRMQYEVVPEFKPEVVPEAVTKAVAEVAQQRWSKPSGQESLGAKTVPKQGQSP